MSNSNLVQAAVTVQGQVESSNEGGLRIDGTWYNYPRGFPKEGKLSRDVVGSLVTLAVLFGDGTQKPLIGSVLKLAKPDGSPPKGAAPTPASPAPLPVPMPAPEAPAAPAAAPEVPEAGWMKEPLSKGQKEKISMLATSLDLSSQMVNLILKMRYKDEQKSVESLTKSEASKLIQFLDSAAPALPQRGRSA
jgi:hypothetical protein